MKHVLMMLLVLFLCVGCTKNVKPTEPVIVAVDKSVPYQCGEPPTADPYIPKDVEWGVQTIASGVRVFTLTGAMYEALMSNLVGAQTSSKQVVAQRDFWANCVERSRTPAPAAVPKPP